MKQSTTQILYNYWNDVRGGRMAPTRFEIEPTRLAPILCETFILERGAAGGFTFRLAGTKVCEQFGRELRGEDFLELAVDDLGAVARGLEAVTTLGAVLRAEIEATAADGRLAVFEAIVLPLVHPADDVTRYLGSLSAINPPPWLGTQPLVSSWLASHSLLWPDGQPASCPDFDERQLPFVPELAAARVFRSAHREFRVLDGGRKE